MIAIILAGGYAHRLRPVSQSMPKALLHVAGRPILDYIMERLVEVKDIRHFIIGTNLRFQHRFESWSTTKPELRIQVLADRSYREEEKPGAVASLATLTSDVEDDCLIVGGDNLFTSSIVEMIQQFGVRRCPTIALYRIKDSRLATQYSTAVVDTDGRITAFIEKPTRPTTALVGTCIYALPQRTLMRLPEYLSGSIDKDNLGGFVGWLCKREPIYGYVLKGYWWDIGTIHQYEEANEVLRGLEAHDRSK